MEAAFQLGGAVGAFAFGLLAARMGYPAVFQTAAVGLGIAFCVLLAAPEGRAARD